MSAVAAANPNTIVVLETGGPVTCPGPIRSRASGGVVSGDRRRGRRLRNMLFGDVNPSGKLPVTFAKSDSQLRIPGGSGHGSEAGGCSGPRSSAATSCTRRSGCHLRRGLQRGCARGLQVVRVANMQPLFPFGYGLSYTSYEYSGLKVDESGTRSASTVRIPARSAGTEIARFMLLSGYGQGRLQAAGSMHRVKLAPGESKK